MNDDNYLKTYGYVLASSYRRRVVKALGEYPKIPTHIANDTEIKVNHISKVLRELVDCGVIKCINPEKRKGRMYRLTKLGVNIESELMLLEV